MKRRAGDNPADEPISKRAKAESKESKESESKETKETKETKVIAGGWRPIEDYDQEVAQVIRSSWYISSAGPASILANYAQHAKLPKPTDVMNDGWNQWSLHPMIGSGLRLIVRQKTTDEKKDDKKNNSSSPTLILDLDQHRSKIQWLHDLKPAPPLPTDQPNPAPSFTQLSSRGSMVKSWIRDTGDIQLVLHWILDNPGEVSLFIWTGAGGP